MYELIIVDDEEIIRKGLSSVVDWDALGFRVAAALPNGDAALSFIAENPVDAVLADIVMPRRSGLDLAAELHRLRPDIKVVILSGYDQSKYARQAIDCSVFGYLLKPSKEAELREVMSRLKLSLDEERRRERLLSLQREEAVARELELRCSAPASVADPSSLPAALIEAWLMVLVVEGIGRYELEEAAGESLRSQLFFFTVGARRACALVHSPSEAGCGAAAETCTAVVAERAAVAAPGFSGGLGRAVKGVAGLAAAYDSAVVNLERRLYLGPGRIAGGGELPGTLVPGEERAAAAAAAAALRAGDLAASSMPARELFGRLRDARIADRSVAEELFRAFLYRLRDELAGYGIDAGAAGLFGAALARIVEETESYEEMGRRVGAAFEAAAGRLAERAADPTRRLALSAKAILDSRFGEDLSLSGVAGELEISPSYLSRLFKQELGYNFKEYLTELRIAEAKRLLGDLSYKVYEIAEMVGFGDQGYFSEIFKQRTGASPLEYRENSG